MSSANPKAKSRYAQAASNIKKELAAAFPGIKFTVRSKSFSMGNSVDVSWELGPTSAEVKSIIDKYQYGDFDGMTDSYNYRADDAFRAANGSAKYVQGSRSFPDGFFEHVCRDIANYQGVPFSSQWQRRENDSLALGDYAHRVLAQTSFPVGAEYIGIATGWELILTGSCLASDTVRIIHSKTDEDAEIRKVIRREFDFIKHKEQEARPRLTLLCGQSTLAPDDLIVPCILPAGHSGYCDTGRA